MENIKLAMTDLEGDMLRRYFSDASHYLEFGAGGSTVEALKSNIKRIDSIEGDIRWIKQLRQTPLIENEEQSGRLTFHHIDIGEIADWGMPKDGKKITQWPNYYLKIWASMPNTPDLVLIDGRFRAACAATAMLVCDDDTKLLIHDFYRTELWRRNYKRILEIANIVEEVGTLVAIERQHSASVADVLALLADVWADFA